jgi:hypothetical protein
MKHIRPRGIPVTISPIFDQLTRRRPDGRRASRRATPVYSSVTPPLGADDLTAAERLIVADMGTTVARLILRMLDDDSRATRR